MVYCKRSRDEGGGEERRGEEKQRSCSGLMTVADV